MIKRFALLSDNEVFTVFTFNTEVDSNFDSIVEQLGQDPLIVNSSSNPNVKSGWSYNGSSFNAPRDPSEEIDEGLDPNADTYFAFINKSNNKVFHMMAANVSNPETEAVPRVFAGLASSPKVIDCTDFDDVSLGWTHDGSSFIAPQE